MLLLCQIKTMKISLKGERIKDIKFFQLSFVLLITYLSFSGFFLEIAKANELENKSYNSESVIKGVESCLRKNPYTIQVYADFEEKNISSEKVLKLKNSNYNNLKFLILNLHPVQTQWYSGYLGLFAKKSDAQKIMDQLLAKDLIPYDSFVYRLSETQMNRIKLEIKKNNLNSEQTLAFANQVLCPKVKNEIKKSQLHQFTPHREKIPSEKKINKKKLEQIQTETAPIKEKFKLSTKSFFGGSAGANLHIFNQNFRNIGQVTQTQIFPTTNFSLFYGVVFNNNFSFDLSYRANSTKTPQIVGATAEIKNKQMSLLNLQLTKSFYANYIDSNWFYSLRYGQYSVPYLSVDINSEVVKMENNSINMISLGLKYKSIESTFLNYEISAYYNYPITKGNKLAIKSQSSYELDYGVWLFHSAPHNLGLFLNHQYYSAQNYTFTDDTTEDYKDLSNIFTAFEIRYLFF